MLRHNCRFLLHLHNISLICIIWQKSQWNPEISCTIEFYWLQLLPNVFICYKKTVPIFNEKPPPNICEQFAKHTLCIVKEAFNQTQLFSSSCVVTTSSGSMTGRILLSFWTQQQQFYSDLVRVFVILSLVLDQIKSSLGIVYWNVRSWWCISINSCGGVH